MIAAPFAAMPLRDAISPFSLMPRRCRLRYAAIRQLPHRRHFFRHTPPPSLFAAADAFAAIADCLLRRAADAAT